MRKNKLFLVLCVVLLVVFTGCGRPQPSDESTTIEENLVATADYSLPYFDFGNGDKEFILLPGASMTSILNSEEGIKALLAPFAEDYHIYVFDVPVELGSINGIGQLADIIADAANAIGIEKADFFGASMGGMIAQKIAVQHPELVRSLSLASSMSRNNELSSRIVSEWSEISEPEELARAINKYVYSEELYEANAEVFNALESAATAEGVERLHNLSRMMEDFSVYEELTQIKCPVFVYAGSNDRILGANASVEIAEKLGCFIKVYENYSHAVYDEYPDFYVDVFANLD